MPSTLLPISYLRSIRSKGWVSLLAALLLVFTASTPAFSAAKPVVKAERIDNLSTEQQYKAAKEYATRLERETSLGRDRGNWLNNARNFRKIHQLDRKGALGPTSLYLMAKTYRRMFELFKVPLDLETALNGLLELADLYPGHTLADDALYDAAECAQQSSGKEQLATDLYLKIVTLYPQGDQYEKAKGKVRVKKTEKEKPPAPVVESPTTIPKQLALLAPVKYWSSEGYSRIVLQPAAPVAFTAGILNKNDSQNRRLTVDLARSYVPPNLRTPMVVRDGLLKEVRSDQYNDETVRVILELDSLSEYTIFSLNDPFRVIVDIRGEAMPSSVRSVDAPSSTVALQQPTLVPVQKVEKKAALGEEDEQIVVSLTEQKKRKPAIEPSPRPQTEPKENLSLAQQLGLGVRTIVIDPGHGGKDPGAMAFGLKEKDVVLNIAKKVAKILKDTYRYEVVLTRTKDRYLPLEERTAIANTHKSDLFMSIHINAHADQTKGGIETYFLNLATDANAMRVAALENATSTHSIGELQDILATLMKNSKIDESTRLARFVHTNLVSGLGRTSKPRDLGVKQAPFYVLIGAEMPAILAEIAFITNPDEAKLLQSDPYLDKVAAQLAAGIAAYVDHRHTAAVQL